VSTDYPSSPLTAKEGWNAFVSGSSLPEPPRLLAAADLERLEPDERELYECARQDYHSELTLVATPDILKITRAGQRLVTSNRGKQLGRKGLMVSGPSGTGKSTSITQLGKIHQVDVERRAPRGAGRIPVVYIIVPPDATPKNVAIEIAAFLGLPYSSHENPHFITHSVASVLRKVGCSMILVDEVHRLDLRTRKGAAASDELKYLFDSVSATFVYAGLDLAENGMFTGTRGRQLASRFITLDTTAFGYATDKEKADWRMLVATLEGALRLHRHKPGTLVDDAAYLHERTSGMIGSLDQLIHEAANDAIADGTEKITRAHLTEITLDTAAEQQYRPAPPRQAATAGRRARS
jgi:Bacterial TniB protein